MDKVFESGATADCQLTQILIVLLPLVVVVVVVVLLLLLLLLLLQLLLVLLLLQRVFLYTRFSRRKSGKHVDSTRSHTFIR